MDVTILWNVKLFDVYFYIDQCQIEQGQTEVLIIKEKCFSETLQVSPFPPKSNSEVGFSYKTFNIEGEENSGQYIVCNIKLCMGDCNAPKAKQCPDTPYFSYSIHGYIP